MTEWYETLDGLWDRAWTLFADTRVRRFVALATMGETGPANRMVVIRAADRAAATLTIYTDATSAKIPEIRRASVASLVYWRAEDALQVRVEGAIEIATGDAVKADWAALDAPQRGNYGVTPPPGTFIDCAHAYARTADEDTFARLTVHAETIDIVHLSPDAHRRCLYVRSTGWKGRWRAP